MKTMNFNPYLCLWRSSWRLNDDKNTMTYWDVSNSSKKIEAINKSQLYSALLEGPNIKLEYVC